MAVLGSLTLSLGVHGWGASAVLGLPAGERQQNKTQDPGAHSTLVTVLFLLEVFSGLSSIFPVRVIVELTDLPKWGFPFALVPWSFSLHICPHEVLVRIQPAQAFLEQTK